MDEELSLFGHLRFPHFNSDQSHPDLLIDLRTEYTKLLNNLFPTSNIFNIFRKLSIIMDTRFNLHSTSLLANDLILSDFSIEGRNPFVSIKHFLESLCIDYPHETFLPKQRISDEYMIAFNETPKPKQGFSGYPNEAAANLIFKEGHSSLEQISDLFHYKFNLSEIQNGSRRLSWKLLNIQLFLSAL